MEKIVTRFIKWILVPIILLILVGYAGHWYGESINCAKCQIGLPNLFNLQDMNQTVLCWMPSHCPVNSK